jgi:hypothetical protein
MLHGSVIVPTKDNALLKDHLMLGPPPSPTSVLRTLVVNTAVNSAEAFRPICEPWSQFVLMAI